MKARKFRHSASQRGSMIIEGAIAYGVLVILALLALKSSITVTSAQQWTLVQGITDAFMTQETALGNRWPFDDIKATGSPWPQYPTITTTSVMIGKMPGGNPIMATLKRTRQPDPNNLATAGGSGDEFTNPGGMEAWKLQSFLVYEVGDREYVKSRTTLRIR